MPLSMTKALLSNKLRALNTRISQIQYIKALVIRQHKFSRKESFEDDIT